jgi:hypothetical protein
VEINDFAFQYSEKGKRQKGNQELGKISKQVAIVATCDRSGREDLRVITKGSLSTEDITKVLNGRVNNVELIVSQSHESYNSLGEKINVDHKKSADTKQKKAEKIYHIQNTKNMYTRLLNFMNPFHGVATKYLQNYMNWFLILEKIRDSTKKIATIMRIALSTDRAWFNYKNKNINIFLRT